MGEGEIFQRSERYGDHFSEVAETGTENYHGRIMVCPPDPMPTPWIASIFCQCHIAPLAPCYVQKLMKSKCGSMAKQTNKTKPYFPTWNLKKVQQLNYNSLDFLRSWGRAASSKAIAEQDKARGGWGRLSTALGHGEGGSWGHGSLPALRDLKLSHQ